MHPKVLNALKESIEHWTDNYNNPTNMSLGAYHCPLCVLLSDLLKRSKRSPDKRCTTDIDGVEVMCPIKERTGKPYCDGTPYDKVVSLRAGYQCSQGSAPLSQYKHVTNWEATLKEAAGKELNFLKSLLPKHKGEII